MAKELTFSMIKPNAVNKRVSGEILMRLERAGFTLAAAKLVQLDREQAEGFYAEHRGKPFFDGLIAFMTSGPVMLLVLSGENAIARYREMMGATDPQKALTGTLRHDYADSLTENAVHGSDSPASAAREIAYFFADDELCLAERA